MEDKQFEKLMKQLDLILMFAGKTALAEANDEEKKKMAEYLDTLGITRVLIAKIADVSPATITNWLK